MVWKRNTRVPCIAARPGAGLWPCSVLRGGMAAAVSGWRAGGRGAVRPGACSRSPGAPGETRPGGGGRRDGPRDAPRRDAPGAPGTSSWAGRGIERPGTAPFPDPTASPEPWAAHPLGAEPSWCRPGFPGSRFGCARSSGWLCADHSPQQLPQSGGEPGAAGFGWLTVRGSARRFPGESGCPAPRGQCSRSRTYAPPPQCAGPVRSRWAAAQHPSGRTTRASAAAHPGRPAGVLDPAWKILLSSVFPSMPRPEPGPEQPEPPSGAGPAQLRRRLQPEAKRF